MTKHEQGASEPPARGLLLVMMEVDPEYEEEFNRWYDEEHVPERLKCAGITSARRFKAVSGSPTYLAIYDLDSPDVIDTPEYQAIYEPSSWRRRISDHFTIVHRVIYRDITAPIPPGYVESLVVERP